MVRPEVLGGKIIAPWAWNTSLLPPPATAMTIPRRCRASATSDSAARFLCPTRLPTTESELAGAQVVSHQRLRVGGRAKDMVGAFVDHRDAVGIYAKAWRICR